MLICMATSTTRVYQSRSADVFRCMSNSLGCNGKNNEGCPSDSRRNAHESRRKSTITPTSEGEGVAWEGRKSPGDRRSQDTCPSACVTVDYLQGEVLLSTRFPTVTLSPRPRSICSKPLTENTTGRTRWAFGNLERAP